MKRSAIKVFVALALIISANLPAHAFRPQTAGQSSRVATRERLRKLLERVGPSVNIAFRQSTKQPFNFVGVLEKGIANAERYEIVIGVSEAETIGFRIFPHYDGGYINAGKAKNNVGLMRKLLQLTDTTFFYWGMDEASDVFAGYTFTLESGFPEEAIVVVLRSASRLDRYVGDLRPFIDGTASASR